MWRKMGFNTTKTWDINDVAKLPWQKREFNDKDMYRMWVEGQGYNPDTIGGLVCDERDNLPSWAYNVKEILVGSYTFKGWNDPTIAFYRMDTGMVVPEHYDTYERYIEHTGAPGIDNIMRAVVFLDNWQSGHYFEIDKMPVVNWKMGLVYVWRGRTPHMAGNFGTEPRYTLQITGWTK